MNHVGGVVVSESDIYPGEQCEWFVEQRAIVGTRIIRTWCSHPDNNGGQCRYSKCPIVEDINDE